MDRQTAEKADSGQQTADRQLFQKCLVSFNWFLYVFVGFSLDFFGQIQNLTTKRTKKRNGQADSKVRQQLLSRSQIRENR